MASWRPSTTTSAPRTPRTRQIKESLPCLFPLRNLFRFNFSKRAKNYVPQPSKIYLPLLRCVLRVLDTLQRTFERGKEWGEGGGIWAPLWGHLSLLRERLFPGKRWEDEEYDVLKSWFPLFLQDCFFFCVCLLEKEGTSRLFAFSWVEPGMNVLLNFLSIYLFVTSFKETENTLNLVLFSIKFILFLKNHIFFQKEKSLKTLK